MDNNKKKMKSKFGCLIKRRTKKEIRIERNCLYYDLFHINTNKLNLVPLIKFLQSPKGRQYFYTLPEKYRSILFEHSIYYSTQRAKIISELQTNLYRFNLDDWDYISNYKNLHPCRFVGEFISSKCGTLKNFNGKIYSERSPFPKVPFFDGKIENRKFVKGNFKDCIFSSNKNSLKTYITGEYKLNSFEGIICNEDVLMSGYFKPYLNGPGIKITIGNDENSKPKLLIGEFKFGKLTKGIKSELDNYQLDVKVIKEKYFSKLNNKLKVKSLIDEVTSSKDKGFEKGRFDFQGNLVGKKGEKFTINYTNNPYARNLKYTTNHQIGCFKNGKLNGKGEQKYQNKQQIILETGEFKDGKLFGKGCEINRVGFEGVYVKKEKGFFVNGFLQKGEKIYSNYAQQKGEWRSRRFYKGISLHSDGTNLDGIWKNGKFFEGKGKKIYSNGEFEGEFKNNLPWNGNIEWKYSNGETLKGELRNRIPYNAKLNYKNKNGDKFEAEFTKGKFNQIGNFEKCPELSIRNIFCPISLEIMRDPVVLTDGHTYDKKSIIKWLQNHNTSPKTNETLIKKGYLPNFTLKSLIDELITKIIEPEGGILTRFINNKIKQSVDDKKNVEFEKKKKLIQENISLSTCCMNSNNLNEVKDDETKESDVNSNDVNSNTEMINNNNVLNSRLLRQESVGWFQHDDAH